MNQPINSASLSGYVYQIKNNFATSTESLSPFKQRIRHNLMIAAYKSDLRISCGRCNSITTVSPEFLTAVEQLQCTECNHLLFQEDKVC